MEFVFWASLALVGFSYVGYPLLLAALTGLREALSGLRYLTGGGDRRRRLREDRWPSISIVFSAFDEEGCIRQKLENCLALDYPPDRIEVLVGCDGCTDRTAALAREVGDPRIQVRELPVRAGKSAVLSRLVPEARGELVVFTDANVMVEKGALRALVRHFQDPEVGAVVGRLRLYNRVRRDYEESLYWSYETLLKYYEGKQGLVLGANGGIYAMRRLLFRPLDPATITDDFVACVQVAARGWRVPFEPEAVAFEETTEDYGREFGRKARIGAGNWQALTLVPQLLDPRQGFLCFAFVAHKLLRWLTPFLLAGALVASAALAARGLLGYQALLAAQVAFYLLALGGRLGAGGPARRLMSSAHYFVAMNAALAVGLWRFLRGTQAAAWARTARNA
ncbi:glycosyltransferase family 2 protein [Anaeromyxobacter paludicola]|uniref:Glycosyl transferase n=1 Tax=Anaeromyxobacter paludicola TaxID=2918171 RepID=A0ABN6N3R7_9BACT|nr:glycosyltransferase family 2 protein [Anaeromyxobacter paludicola]BDG07701.1 glycosyl transferase [Anaeromyxobacter paludicola]